MHQTAPLPAPGQNRQHPAPPLPGQILRDPAWHLAALFALAIAFGGHGVGAGVSNLVVQLAAILVMALHPRAFSLFFLRKPRWLAALVVLSIALPAIQLVPLPPALWSALPGRDMVRAALDLSGGTGWFPLSLDSGRTLTAVMGTLLPLGVIVVGSVLPPERLRWLVNTVVLLGACAMIYGALSLLAPQAPDSDAKLAATVGKFPRMGATFSDWNAAALFFDGCLLLLVGTQGREEEGRPLSWRMGLSVCAALLLLLGVFLTQSRTGLALLAVPLALLVMRVLARKGGLGTARASQAMLVATVLGGLILAALAFAGNSRLSATFDRLATGEDGKRAEMREDALTTARHYWPVGSGMGTFDEVFQVDESLEYLSPRTAGRAHMDYYELAIEAGISGLALLLGWFAWLLVATWAALRRADWMALAGAGLLASCALQSLLAFPLRNQTMLAMAALAVVLLSRALQEARRARSGKEQEPS